MSVRLFRHADIFMPRHTPLFRLFRHAAIDAISPRHMPPLFSPFRLFFFTCCRYFFEPTFHADISLCAITPILSLFRFHCHFAIDDIDITIIVMISFSDISRHY
jgi:hypothetical protein